MTIAQLDRSPRRTTAEHAVPPAVSPITSESTPAHDDAGGAWGHGDFVRNIVDLVDRYGAAHALHCVLSDSRGVPTAGGRRHHTLAAYFVWAVDWLLSAGLEPWEVLWHPLVGANSPRAWYDAEVLASATAHDGFVDPPVFGAGAPTPADFSIVDWLANPTIV